MRVLVGTGPSKIYIVKEFVKALEQRDHECMYMELIDYPYILNKKPLRWFKNILKFRGITKEFKPDMIIVDCFNAFSTWASKSEIPTYILLHGDHWREQRSDKDGKYSKMNCIQKFTYNKRMKSVESAFSNATGILTVCEYLKKVVSEKYPHKKIRVLYKGIDATQWQHRSGMKLKHPCVGLLQGAVILDKTKEMLILDKVISSMPHVTFYWAGDGVFKDMVLSKLDKHENFEYLGKLDYPDKVQEYLTEIDMYALITGLDMGPLSLQEAQLMMKPVIATDVAGVKEVMLDGVTGYLVEQGNADDIIEKISRILSDKTRATKMGVKGRDFIVENFTMERLCSVFEKSVTS